MKKTILNLFGMLLLIMLSACGGGGGGGGNDGGSAGGGSGGGGGQTYTIGGSMSGLATGKSVTLQNSGGNNTVVSANGGFTISGSVASGTSYQVTVLTQPSGQNCTITNGVGTVANANVTNLLVTCAASAAFSGFDFALKAEDFWEYRWDYYKQSGGMGISTTTTTDKGRFWVVLGSGTTIIDGITAYPVTILGKTQANGGDNFTPRWKYLAMSGNKLLGSTDGASLQTIFDAATGSWPGGGFFTSFSPSTLIVAENGTLTNDYLTTAAIRTGWSLNNAQCQYFPSIGSICGDSSQTVKEYDWYKSGIGPVGYSYENSYNDCGGGFCTWANWNHHLGMTKTSFAGGAVLPIGADNTNNGTPVLAPPLTVPNAVLGNLQTGVDAGYATNVSVNGTLVGVTIEDWYKITLTAQTTLTITLSFEDSPTADLDLYIFTAGTRGGYTVYNNLMSVEDNPLKKYGNERIVATLPAGTYYIAVDGYVTPARVPYVLQVE